MDSHGLIVNLIVYLSAAVIAVPLFARWGLGSVLGYLAAGICIGHATRVRNNLLASNGATHETACSMQRSCQFNKVANRGLIRPQ